MVSKGLENAQKRVESRNFSIRKNVLEYDDVINQQREVIYGERKKVLFGEDLKETVSSMIDDVIDAVVESFAGEAKWSDEWDLNGLLTYLDQHVIPAPAFSTEDLTGQTRESVQDFLKEQTHHLYEAREAEMGSETMRELERRILLHFIDQKWMDHIDAMDQLRNGISLRAYGQKDPLIEYKFEAYEAFQAMVYSIKEDVVRFVLRVKVVKEPEEHKAVVYSSNNEESSRKPVRSKKVGRNEPCPCGSGKKYKQCCGREDN